MSVLLNDHWNPIPPTRILNQHFGMPLILDDVFNPPAHPADVRAWQRCPAGYYRPWQHPAAKNDHGSAIKATKAEFQVNLDVQQFAPEEITVKLCGDNKVTVEGKHDEKPDEHGHVFRHFVRKYILPDVQHVQHVMASLSSDGVLSITVPRIEKGAKEEEHFVPIHHTGRPLMEAVVEQAVEAKKTQKDDHIS